VLQRICLKKVICGLKNFMILSTIVVKNKIWNWVILKLTFLEILMKKLKIYNKYLKEDINQKQLKIDTLILRVWIYKLIIMISFIFLK
jgi:hypothetical protein